MPIRPIDFQIMIPRTVDASKSQNDEFSKLLNVQKLTNENLHQESEKGMKQVQHSDKPYKPGINKDGKGNTRKEQDENKSGSRKHEESEEKDPNNTKSGNQPVAHIDIKI